MTYSMPNFCTILTNRIYTATLYRRYYNSFCRYSFSKTIQSQICNNNVIGSNYTLPFTCITNNYRGFSTKVKSTRTSDKKVVKEAEKTPNKEVNSGSDKVNPLNKSQTEPTGVKAQANVTQNLSSGIGTNKPNLGKPYKPEVPILYYTATKRATDSINHRLFYINILFLIFLYDIGTGLIDY